MKELQCLLLQEYASPDALTTVCSDLIAAIHCNATLLQGSTVDNQDYSSYRNKMMMKNRCQKGEKSNPLLKDSLQSIIHEISQHISKSSQPPPPSPQPDISYFLLQLTYWLTKLLEAIDNSTPHVEGKLRDGSNVDETKLSKQSSSSLMAVATLISTVVSYIAIYHDAMGNYNQHCEGRSQMSDSHPHLGRRHHHVSKDMTVNDDDDDDDDDLIDVVDHEDDNDTDDTMETDSKLSHDDQSITASSSLQEFDDDHQNNSNKCKLKKELSGKKLDILPKHDQEIDSHQSDLAPIASIAYTSNNFINSTALTDIDCHTTTTNSDCCISKEPTTSPTIVSSSSAQMANTAVKILPPPFDFNYALRNQADKTLHHPCLSNIMTSIPATPHFNAQILYSHDGKHLASYVPPTTPLLNPTLGQHHPTNLLTSNLLCPYCSLTLTKYTDNQFNQHYTCTHCRHHFPIPLPSSSTLTPTTSASSTSSMTPSAPPPTHIKQHKIYRCKDCKKVFSDSSTLQRHRSVHSAERPFKCRTCFAAFKLKHHLQRHEKLHASLVTCTECRRTFSHLSQLHNHIRRRH